MEPKHSKGDKYEDIQMQSPEKIKILTEELVRKLLTDKMDHERDVSKEETILVDKQLIQQRASELQTASQFQKDTKVRKKEKRELRVFVSSTFQDFFDEREQIIKNTFSEINRKCIQRGVFFSYVDLRWGITSEQSHDGKTISICLQEVDRCRPYFVCLMGERFGWSQIDKNPDSTLNKTFDYAIENPPYFRWIEEYRYKTSVTQEVETQADWQRECQKLLKSEVIEKIDATRVKRFNSASEVAHLIKMDLERCIDEDFPEGSELTKLEQQRKAHMVFADARCSVYIKREEYFTTINDYRASQKTKPFVLLGDSGCGKSALVANWVKNVEELEPHTFTFVHFIGSCAESANYLNLLRRLYEELKEHFNLNTQIPSADSYLINELNEWLWMASSRSKIIIALDALNQLDTGSGRTGPEHELLWIPKELPPNVFMLLTTLPGRAMDACKQFDWPCMTVESLDQSEKEKISTGYLKGVYRKTLDKKQMDLIVEAEQTNNALYLRALLDEVRLFGVFEKLTPTIEDYLEAKNAGDLFGKILKRLEADFETGWSGRKDLVKDATVALWCSNRGMAEAELKEHLKVTNVVWSPFYLSLCENLVNRDGILNFFHDYLRQAVEKKYLSSPEEKRLGYLKVANFFSDNDLSGRKVEELPFLLTKAGEKERLKDFISDPYVFIQMANNGDGIFELTKAWKYVGGFSLAEEAYSRTLADISKQGVDEIKFYGQLGKFFQVLGLHEGAKNVFLALTKQLENEYGETHGVVVYDALSFRRTYKCKHPAVIEALQALGEVYYKMGELHLATETYEDAIERQNRLETPKQKLQLCEGLLGLATVNIGKDDMAGAKKLLTRSLEIALEIFGKKHHFVAAIFTKLGQLSYKQGRIDETLTFFINDLQLTISELGIYHPCTAIVLNEIALVYEDKNDEIATKLLEAVLAIFLETYGKNYVGTGIIRYNLGVSYLQNNYYLKALFQFEESCRVLGAFLGSDHKDTKAARVAKETAFKMTKK